MVLVLPGRRDQCRGGDPQTMRPRAKQATRVFRDFWPKFYECQLVVDPDQAV